MNERTKEIFAHVLDTHFSNTWTTLDYYDLQKFADKFSEMIVHDCSKFLMDTMDDHFAAEEMLDHFGVEK